VFFFLLLLRPPLPTLFPYTTLFRSLRSRRRGADVADDPAGARRLVRVVPQRAPGDVDTERAGDVREGIGREHLAAGAVDDIEMAVAVGVQQYLACRAADREIDEHVLVGAVVGEEIVRAQLVEPRRGSVAGPAREQAAR